MTNKSADGETTGDNRSPAQTPHLASSSLVSGLQSIVRGELSPAKATLELMRRWRVGLNERRERSQLAKADLDEPRLRDDVRSLTPKSLLDQFRTRPSPLFSNDLGSVARLHRKLYPAESEQLIQSAWQILREHRWPLLGLGELTFGPKINWHRDPMSGAEWPCTFHADVNLRPNDGSDVRVLWELNRLGHLLSLGQAYVLTEEEQFAEEFFQQVESWRAQNPALRGANWACAMEVGLRAINLLAALMLFRHSRALNEDRFLSFLSLIEQHGTYIRGHLEFSFTGTSNHYISDLAGLLWIGILMPELKAAREWRGWSLRELVREMDKQVLPDGVHFEGSTGYHRFVVELFLYSFVLCRKNEIEIPEAYLKKLAGMLRYIRVYLRPEGGAPLIGDSDGGQVLPMVRRRADDHGYLLSLGAVVFQDSSLKAAPGIPPEVLWLLGEEAASDCERLSLSHTPPSQGFPHAGVYLSRSDDLYLLFNVSVGGRVGRASHRHNDALSIEVSACGREFIVDPGTFVYTADLSERHAFRSTAYHSTMQVDNMEQNSINKSEPFLIGREARPRVLAWETKEDRDVLVAEHDGYNRHPGFVRHLRRMTFDKKNRWWLLDDEVECSGAHVITVRFHFDSGLEVDCKDQTLAVACDSPTGARLLVYSVNFSGNLELESQFVSRHYGAKEPSLSACWSKNIYGTEKFRWALVPVARHEDEAERLRIVQSQMD